MAPAILSLSESWSFFSQPLQSGDPFDESVRHGPLVSEKQMAKVLEYIEKGKKEGWWLAVGPVRVALHDAWCMAASI